MSLLSEAPQLRRPLGALITYRMAVLNLFIQAIGLTPSAQWLSLWLTDAFGNLSFKGLDNLVQEEHLLREPLKGRPCAAEIHHVQMPQL